MCLLIEIDMPGVPREAAGDVTRAIGRQGLLALRAQRTPKGHAGARFLLETGEGCACGLLADNADWDVPAYRLASDSMPQLERLLAEVTSAAGAQGFHLRAVWVTGGLDGIPARAERSVRWTELRQEVRGAQIGSNVRYHVTGTPA